jgi:aldehyde dehydrogenase (NAD+)
MEKVVMERLYKSQKEFFWSGRSRDIDFRIESLKLLKDAIKIHEKDVLDALYNDLRRARFDAYVTEIGMIYHEIGHAIRHLRSWAEPVKVKTPYFMWPSKSYMQKEPFGVSLIIAPWNYPFQLMMAPLIGSIAAGNTAILKPSEISFNTAAAIEKIINTAFLKEYLHVVQGGIAETQALLELPVDFIFFTGSVPVGKIVMRAAAQNMTPVALELGGKSPAIIHEDANLTDAVRKIAWGKFLNAGQTCVAPDYVLVHSAVKDAFLEELKKGLHDFYGDDASQHPRYCRIISDRHFQRLIGLIDHEKIVIGGRTHSLDRYIEPTVLYPVDWDEPVMQDEIFGPILPVLVYTELNDIIRKINEQPKPLALYLFSDDRFVQTRITQEISYGGGAINNTVVHAASHFLPFGGVGPSGMGRYHGKASFDAFSHYKGIVKSPSRFDPGLAYPDKNLSLKWLKVLMPRFFP